VLLGKALGGGHSQNKGPLRGGAEVASYSENALPQGLCPVQSTATEHSKSEKLLCYREELLKNSKVPPLSRGTFMVIMCPLSTMWK